MERYTIYLSESVRALSSFSLPTIFHLLLRFIILGLAHIFKAGEIVL